MARDIDIETLRLIVAVADLGSVSAAARALGLSQPAATHRIRAFEARWRLAIIERTPRGSTMTADGAAVVSWARSVLREADAMLEGLEARSTQRATQVLVAASLTVAGYVLPRWLGELQTRLPDVEPTLRVVNSDQVVELVRAGKVDVGFIEAASGPQDLVKRVVGSDRLVVVVHPSHAWARRRTPVGLEFLTEARWVLREEGSGSRRTFELALGERPRRALEVSSTAALIGAALEGVGPAVVPARAVVAHLEAGRLRDVPTELNLTRPLTAVWSPAVRLSDPVTALLNIATTAEGAVSE